MAQQVEAYRPTPPHPHCNCGVFVRWSRRSDSTSCGASCNRAVPRSFTWGHNRSVAEIVQCAIQEDVQAVAVTSYQGGHMEFFTYMHDLLGERGAGHIRIFGGGGGTILPSEIEELHRYGITRIYSPDDGRAMGLQGMINDVLEKSDFETPLTFTPR
ncbi:MAG: hypothetical protein KatS3mg038_3750 [Candidatus Kapaibacterium sp.]|nr:MAG: hypothetical protein KatS3mg038_3750 [Candidatus Kapabacteria bacterium]